LYSFAHQHNFTAVTFSTHYNASIVLLRTWQPTSETTTSTISCST